MDQAKPEERQVSQVNAVESSSLQEKLAADSRDLNIGAPTALKAPEASNQADAGAAKFLPSYDLDNQLAIWQGGENNRAGVASPGSDENQGRGWSERYAANFDQPGGPQHLDMAPILGLPQGASKEDLLKTAHAQEDELLKQLIS